MFGQCAGWAMAKNMTFRLVKGSAQTAVCSNLEISTAENTTRVVQFSRMPPEHHMPPAGQIDQMAVNVYASLLNWTANLRVSPLHFEHHTVACSFLFP
jgi:hypothetical protein